MTTMDSLNRDSYMGNSESERMSLNVSVLPLTSSSASNINVQAEVSTQSLADKTLCTPLPEITTTSDNSSNYMLINLQEFQDKVWNEMGKPFLVLTNNEKGNVEAKVLYNTSSVGLIKIPAGGTNIHTLTQSSIVVQPANKTVKPTPKTLICVSSEQAATDDKIETPTQTCLESKKLLTTFDSSVIGPTTAEDAVSAPLDAEQDPTGCAKTFTTIGYKKCNPQTSQGGQRSLECSFEGCGRKFSWPAHLKYHQMTHTGERQYACTSDGCLKTFYTSQRLAVHIRTHTGEKPFKCQEEGCEKAFTTAGNLKNHIRVHTGERPFVCGYVGCSRSFAEYSSLRKHKLVHTGEKPFICDECGKSFSQSGSRTVHIKRHHGIGTKKGKETAAGGEGSITQQHPPTASNDVGLDKKDANVFILRNTGAVEEDEDIMQYQDFPGGESVVFSQDMSEQIVTVTTQPSTAAAAGEVEERVIGDHIVTVTNQPSTGDETQDRDNTDEPSQEMLSSEILPDDGLTRVSLSSNSANVMVLSQPQEMVALGGSSSSSTYHATRATSQGTDDIVYESALQHDDLAHKEMSTNLGGHHHHHHILTMSASLSPRQELSEGTASMLHSSKEVRLDPMMASDDEDEDGLSIGIQQHAKVD